MCKSPLFTNYLFCMIFFSYGGLACRHRAFRLYLFAAAALLRRCFSASAPKTADAFSSSKKDTASIAVRKQPSLYMYVTHPYRRNWLWGRYFIYTNYIYFFKLVSLLQYMYLNTSNLQAIYLAIPHSISFHPHILAITHDR